MPHHPDPQAAPGADHAAEVRRRAAEDERKKLEQIIQQSLPTEIPPDALIRPQAGSGSGIAPAN